MTKKLPNAIYSEDIGVHTSKKTIMKYIIEKYGLDTYEAMKDSKIYCKYCKRKVPEWDFSPKQALKHNIMCIERAIIEERRYLKKGLLITHWKNKRIKEVCYNCSHYSRNKSLCHKFNIWIGNDKSRSCPRWKVGGKDYLI